MYIFTGKCSNLETETEKLFLQTKVNELQMKNVIDEN